MYKIVIQGSSEETILDYRNPDVAFLGDAKITTGISCEIATFEFKIYQSNPGYSSIQVSRTRVKVYDLLENEIIFRGRVASIEESMDDSGLNEKTVSCESEIAMLCDTVIFNYYIASGGLSSYILDQLITNHNAYASSDAQFTVGECELAGCPVKVELYEGSTSYEAIKTIFEDTFGGEIRLRYENDVRYIDFTTTTFGEIVEDGLRTKVNIKSMAKKEEISEIFSRIIPLSGEPESGTKRLTILPYTSKMSSSDENYNKDYLENKSLYEKYGPIYKIVTFDDIKVSDDDPDPDHISESGQLYRAAVDWMDDYVYKTETFEVSALDLSFINKEFNRFKVGNTYTILNPFLSIQTTIRLIKIELDLSTPYAPTLTFGSRDIKLTDIVAKSK
jgi:hypothetical protein